MPGRGWAVREDAGSVSPIVPLPGAGAICVPDCPLARGRSRQGSAARGCVLLWVSQQRGIVSDLRGFFSPPVRSGVGARWSSPISHHTLMENAPFALGTGGGAGWGFGVSGVVFEGCQHPPMAPGQRWGPGGAGDALPGPGCGRAGGARAEHPKKRCRAWHSDRECPLSPASPR